MASTHPGRQGDRRNATTIPGPLNRLAKLPAFPVWQAALGLFSVTAVVVFVAALVAPGLFR